VYWVDLNPVKGAELAKVRLALVIQNDTGNKYSPVTIVAPLSSTKEITKPLPVMVFLQDGEAGEPGEGYVDCGQIRTVDKSRLVDKCGHLGKERMSKVNRAIRISLSV
jgi:mRNA interferase MazF